MKKKKRGMQQMRRSEQLKFGMFSDYVLVVGATFTQINNKDYFLLLNIIY